MDAYLKDLKNICDQLASVGSPVTEKMKIFAALNGVDILQLSTPFK